MSQDYNNYGYQQQQQQEEGFESNFEEPTSTVDEDRLSQPLKLFVGQVPKTYEETDLAMLLPIDGEAWMVQRLLLSATFAMVTTS